MKKKFTYISLFGLALLSASCSDFLDEMPDNRTELTTEASIAKILVSAYPSTTACEIGEMHGDNVDANDPTLYSYFSRLEMHMYLWQQTTEEDQDSPHALWTDSYSAIASANQALQAIEKMGNPASLQPQKGEALLCRAYNHFQLATIFCHAYRESKAEQDLGIPYMDGVETTVNPHYTRGTLAETYKKIAEDIEAGLPLIDDAVYSKPKYHFNKKAAYAFAARFFLYYMKNDFSNCRKVIEYANQVLGTNASEVLRDWGALGRLASNGDVQPNEFVNSDLQANLLLVSANSYWPLVADPGYSPSELYCNNAVTSIENCNSQGPWGAYTVYRQKPFTPGGSIKNGFRRLAIYQEFSTSGDSWSGHMMLPAFTTDETLLCRAEAYALLKQYDAAVADINAWQKAFTLNTSTLTQESINNFYANRLSYSAPQNPSVKKELHPDFTVEQGVQESLIHCILHARRVLTLEEGLRWHDIKRYGIVIYRRLFQGQTLVAITDEMDVDDPRRAVQLPANVITAGIQPNPRNN